MKFPDKSANNSKTARENVGEQRRLDSIKQRQKEEQKRRNIISQSLAAGITHTGKHIKFEVSDDSDEEEEQEIPEPSTSSKKVPNVEFPPAAGEDPRFAMNKLFFEEHGDDGTQQNGNLTAEHQHDFSVLSKVLGKEVRPRKKASNSTSTAPPFRRYDPSNPEHVEWVRRMQKVAEIKQEVAEEETQNERNEKSQQKPHRSIADVDPQFANELRRKLNSKDKEEEDDQKPFTFLRNFGKIKSEPLEEKQGQIDEEMDLDLETAKEQKRQKRKQKQIKKELENGFAHNGTNNGTKSSTISLYKEPRNGEKHVPYFFVDPSDGDLKGAMASFRRHVSVEKLREKWPREREPMLKFYKHERKLALKNMRARQKAFGNSQHPVGQKQEEGAN